MREHRTRMIILAPAARLLASKGHGALMVASLIRSKAAPISLSETFRSHFSGRKSSSASCRLRLLEDPVTPPPRYARKLHHFSFVKAESSGPSKDIMEEGKEEEEVLVNGVAHIVLTVSDFNRSAHYYRRLCGDFFKMTKVLRNCGREKEIF